MKEIVGHILNIVLFCILIAFLIGIYIVTANTHTGDARGFLALLKESPLLDLYSPVSVRLLAFIALSSAVVVPLEIYAGYAFIFIVEFNMSCGEVERVEKMRMLFGYIEQVMMLVAGVMMAIIANKMAPYLAISSIHTWLIRLVIFIWFGCAGTTAYVLARTIHLVLRKRV